MTSKSYQEVDKELLGFKGALYPSDMKIEVRGADVPEIRMWSEIDESDPRSIAKSAIDIITACTRVTSETGAHHYSAKDLYEHDKMAMLLIIHSITFAEQKNNSLYTQGECDNPSCGKTFEKLAVQVANLTYKIPDEKYQKYVDTEIGAFRIQTKSRGEIVYKPSTIGLGSAMLNWMQTFKPNFIREHQQMFRIVQSFVTDWRQANDKFLRKLQIEEYNNLSAEDLGFWTNIVDKFSIELNDELEYICPDCGATFRCPLAFETRYRQMFVPVQSLDDELL